MNERSSEQDRISVPEPLSEEEKGFQVPYRQILRYQMADAMREFERPSSGLATSAFSAGLDVGFGPFLMVVYLTVGGGDPGEPTSRLILAGLYSIGFVLVVLGRSELFTEHTTMAVLPVLSGQARLAALFRVWSIVWAGNLVGAVVFAAFATFVGVRLGIADSSALGGIATALTGHPWRVVFMSAVLAGWLMGLLTWLVGAARETISQLVVVVLTAGSIGFAGFHHAIAGSVEVLFGVFDGAVTMTAFVVFLIWATIGNALGGGVFVALLKYAHVVRSEPEPGENLGAET